MPVAESSSKIVQGSDKEWVELYTDGSCQGNPGLGGWGLVLRWRGHERESSGGSYDTTNNRMEMTAVLEGLRMIRRPLPVRIVTDSQYVQKGLTGWVDRWRRNGWKTAAKKAVENQELWQALVAELERFPQWRVEWVRGHEGHPENERADRLARAAWPT